MQHSPAAHTAHQLTCCAAQPAMHAQLSLPRGTAVPGRTFFSDGKLTGRGTASLAPALVLCSSDAMGSVWHPLGTAAVNSRPGGGSGGSSGAVAGRQPGAPPRPACHRRLTGVTAEAAGRQEALWRATSSSMHGAARRWRLWTVDTASWTRLGGTERYESRAGQAGAAEPVPLSLACAGHVCAAPGAHTPGMNASSHTGIAWTVGPPPCCQLCQEGRQLQPIAQQTSKSCSCNSASLHCGRAASMALAAAPCSTLTQRASGSSGRITRSSGPAQQRAARLRVQAVAAPAAAMKTFQAPLSAEQLKEFTSRPRIDFSKILDTVRHRCGWAMGKRAWPCCPAAATPVVEPHSASNAGLAIAACACLLIAVATARCAAVRF